MTHQLTLTLSEAMFQSLMQKAQREGRPPDGIILETLERLLSDETDDPLLQMLGTLEADVYDLGARHDHYLAQAHTREKA